MPKKGSHSSRGASMAMARSYEHLMEVLLVLSALCLSCTQAAAASETPILLNFKASIRDGGGDLANWSPADASPCNWTGVRCVDGVVTELSLHDMNVSGAVPIGLGMKLTLPLGSSLSFGY